MSIVGIRTAQRPSPDQVLVDIADYVCEYDITSEEAYSTARYCLMDSLACAMLAMKFPGCTRLLGPMVPGAEMPSLREMASLPAQGSPLFSSAPLRLCARYSFADPGIITGRH